ncbi:MAG: DAK2 domain-containing protein [Anaerolineales bacterium]|nr:DAK2 domain-containing protein [Anaerolineales bacterium]
MQLQSRATPPSPSTIAPTGLDLSNLFNLALQNVSAHREQINALDGANGNHGDNMVHNLQVIVQALQSQRGHTPSEQLSYAAGQLQSNSRGSTGQYYAQGLTEAATRFQGKQALNQNDIGSLLRAMLGNVPVKPSNQPQPQAGSDPMAALLGGLMGGSAPQTPAGSDPMAALLGSLISGGTPQPQSGANVLTALLGMLQQPQPRPGNEGLDLGDLLTAGLAFIQAKQQGADNLQAGMQALMAALAGGQINPLQSGSPQAAAGGLIAQSLLQAALGGRK